MLWISSPIHNQVGDPCKSKAQTKFCQTSKHLEWTFTKQGICSCEFTDLTASALSILTSTWPQRFSPRRTQHCSEDKWAGLSVRSSPPVLYEGSRIPGQMACCTYMLGCWVVWILIFSLCKSCLWGSCSLSGPSRISDTTHFVRVTLYFLSSGFNTEVSFDSAKEFSLKCIKTFFFFFASLLCCQL